MLQQCRAWCQPCNSAEQNLLPRVKAPARRAHLTVKAAVAAADWLPCCRHLRLPAAAPALRAAAPRGAPLVAAVAAVVEGPSLLRRVDWKVAAEGVAGAPLLCYLHCVLAGAAVVAAAAEGLGQAPSPPQPSPPQQPQLQRPLAALSPAGQLLAAWQVRQRGPVALLLVTGR